MVPGKLRSIARKYKVQPYVYLQKEREHAPNARVV